MKIFTALFFLLLTFHSALGRDVRANYCEIFIDKVLAAEGPFNSHNITFFIKTLNSRLDGQIVEVGMRYQEVVANANGFIILQKHIEEKLAVPFFKSMDYFDLTLSVVHSDGTIAYTGSFFVKTTRGTTYWLNPSRELDFVINMGTYDWIKSKNSFDGLPTQGSEFSYFNPAQCY